MALSAPSARPCDNNPPPQVCTTRNCGSSSGGYSYSSSRSRGLSTANMCILGGVLVAVCLLCIFIMHYRISVGRMQARKRWQRELVADPQRSRERSSGGEPATLGLPLEYSPYMGVQPPSTPQSQMSNPQAGRTSGWSDAGAPAPPPTGRCVPADGVPCGQAGGQHEGVGGGRALVGGRGGLGGGQREVWVPVPSGVPGEEVPFGCPEPTCRGNTGKRM